MTALQAFLYSIVFTGLLAEAIAEAIVESGPGNKLQFWLSTKSDFLGDLFSCGRCISFWTSAPAAYFIWSKQELMLWTLPLIWLIGWRLSSLLHDAFNLLRHLLVAQRAEGAVREMAVEEAVQIAAMIDRRQQPGADEKAAVQDFLLKIAKDLQAKKGPPAAG
jgi:hypothetical protein